MYLSLNPFIPPGNKFSSLVVAKIAVVPTLASLESKFTPTTKGALRAKKKKVSFQNEILNVIVTSILILSAALNKCRPPKKIC